MTDTSLLSSSAPAGPPTFPPPQPTTDLTAVPPPAAFVAPLTDEVHIRYNPMPAAERVAHYTGLVRTRLIWLGMAAGICLIFWGFQGSALGKVATVALFASGLGYSAIWLLMALAGLWRARRALHSIGQGVALRLNRWGVDIHGVALPWSDITAVKARRRRFSAYGPELAVVTATHGVKTLPWLFLDTLPGSLDAAIRAYTADAHHLDVSRLDH